MGVWIAAWSSLMLMLGFFLLSSSPQGACLCSSLHHPKGLYMGGAVRILQLQPPPRLLSRPGKWALGCGQIQAQGHLGPWAPLGSDSRVKRLCGFSYVKCGQPPQSKLHRACAAAARLTANRHCRSNRTRRPSDHALPLPNASSSRRLTSVRYTEIPRELPLPEPQQVLPTRMLQESSD